VHRGTDALAAREMVVLTYMIFNYTLLIVLGQRGFTIKYWVNWILRGAQEAVLKGVRTRLRCHVVLGVGIQLLAYAVLLMFWIFLYEDMQCGDVGDTYAFFFYPFFAFGIFRWIMIGLLGLYTIVLVYWLFDTIRNVYMNEKYLKWCKNILQVLNGSKQETTVPKGTGPRGAFVGALMAVVELGDSRAQMLHGMKPTTAITRSALAVEELVDGARFQGRLVSSLLFIWIVTNALAVELIFDWNNIDDTSSLTRYDQILPLTVGTWTFLQSFFPSDESFINSEQALRHVTTWCDAGNEQTSILETMRTGKVSVDGDGRTRAFLRYFV
jgi:hypothetical protein